MKNLFEKFGGIAGIIFFILSILSFFLFNSLLSLFFFILTAFSLNPYYTINTIRQQLSLTEQIPYLWLFNPIYRLIFHVFFLSNNIWFIFLMWKITSNYYITIFSTVLIFFILPRIMSKICFSIITSNKY